MGYRSMDDMVPYHAIIDDHQPAGLRLGSKTEGPIDSSEMTNVLDDSLDGLL